MLAVMLALAGCASRAGEDPIAWWRQLEGGRLAEARPLPPKADAPYPNLSTVPARPTTTGATARARIAAGLASDQREGAHAATQTIGSGAARRVAPEPTAAGGIGASLAAASAPDAPAPAPAPVVVAPAVTPMTAIATAALTLPAAPPAPPRLPGVAAVTAPTTPRRAPPPAPPAVAAFAPGAPVGIGFAAQSAVLPPDAPGPLRQLAATRAGRDILATGYGQAEGSDAASQAATLALAFARARAISAALVQAGVPEDSIRVRAQAIGRGGVARVAE